MTHLPVTRELRPLERPADRQVKSEPTAWQQFVSGITNSEFVLVAAFCAIGLLIALNLVLHFPDVGTASDPSQLIGP